MYIDIDGFQSAFHKDIGWLRDMGILERLKYDITRPPHAKPYPKFWRDKPLIISQLGIVMIILAAGLGLSFPVFLCELMRGRGKKMFNEVEDRKNLTLTKDEHLTVTFHR